MMPVRRLGVALVLAATVLPTGPAATAAGPDSRSLWLYNTHTTEELSVRPFRRHGQLRALAWRRLNHFFRSWRTGQRRPMHPRLIRSLAHIQRHFGGRRIEVVSGFRVPEDPDALSSYHQVGRAADVRIDGVDKRELFDFCRTLPKLGCGYYPNTSFVHIDVRGRSGVWVDVSRAGAPARYVRDARRWLRVRKRRP